MKRKSTAEYMAEVRNLVTHSDEGENSHSEQADEGNAEFEAQMWDLVSEEGDSSVSSNSSDSDGGD